MVALPHALVVVGGVFHDWLGFADFARELLPKAGLEPQISFDLADLARLEELAPRLVVLYSCLDARSGLAHTSAELDALTAWLRRGGALFALHAASVAAAHQPALESVLGAAFAGHPAYAGVRVQPAPPAHPTTRELRAFEIQDELYRHRAPPQGQVHLIAEGASGAEPVAWSRLEGNGRVYYLALGHDAGAWQHPEYRRLCVAIARWLAFDG